MKICADCKHCSVIEIRHHHLMSIHVSQMTHYLCEKSERVNMVTGKSEGSRRCEDCRNDAMLCGVEAKHWEPKEVTP